MGTGHAAYLSAQNAPTNRLSGEQRKTAIVHIRAAGPMAHFRTLVSELQHMGISINVDGVLRLMDQTPTSEPLVFNKDTRGWLRAQLNVMPEFKREVLLDAFQDRCGKLPNTHRLASEILLYRNEVLQSATAGTRSIRSLPAWLRANVLEEVSRKEIVSLANRHHKTMTRNEFLVVLIGEGFPISSQQLPAYVIPQPEQQNTAEKPQKASSLWARCLKQLYDQIGKEWHLVKP